MKIPFSKFLKERSLSKVFLSTMLGINFTLLTLLGIFSIYQENKRFELESQNLRGDYINNQRKILRNETKTLNNFIHNERIQARDNLKKEIKQKVYNAHQVAMSLYEIYKDKVTKQELQKIIITALIPSIQNDSKEYIYINDLDGNIVSNPNITQSERINILFIKDANGSPVIKNEIETIKNKGEGFTNYSWQKIKDQKIYPKISFVKIFKPFNWYIGVKQYVNSYKKELQQKILSKITQLSFNDDLSIVVFSYKGTCLASTNKNQIGKRLWDLEDQNKTKIIQKLIYRGTDPHGGYFQYLDPLKKVNESPSSILMFAKNFKDWQWVVGSGIYLHELEEAIASKKADLQKRVNLYIQNTILVLLASYLIIFIFFRFIVKASQEGLRVFSTFFKKTATGSTKIDTSNLHFKEFLSLAEAANRMIEKRQIAEHRLNIETAYFEQLFENSPEAIAFTDNQSRGIKVNRQFTKMFGFTNNQIKGIVIDKLLADEAHQSEAKKLTTITSRGDLVEIETQRKCENGKIIDVSIMGNPIIMDGKPIAVFGIYRDITSRKQYEKHLQMSKEMAEESDNLKSAFLSSISHEIRTPMNHILGFADIISSTSITDQERNEYTSLIKESGTNLLDLINNIVDFSKIESKQIHINKQSCCINHILSHLLEKFTNQKNNCNKRHLELTIHPSLNDQESIIITDPQRLEQLFSNLIDNAVKFTYSGNIKFGYTLDNLQEIQFFVQDTGIGISPKYQKAIFKSFRQIDGSNTRKYGGTGLGLAITQRLIELMDGNIWLESKVNIGTTFYFTLPLCNPVSRQKIIDPNKKDIQYSLYQS